MLSKDDLISASFEGTDPASLSMAAVLPDKTSDLIELAVRDAKKAARTPGVEFDMDVFMRVDWDHNTCRVCMAGSILLNTFKVRKHDYMLVLSTDVWHKLWVVNDARVGDIEGGETAPQRIAVDAANALITKKYDQDLKRAPWGIYLKAARMLREVGL